MIIEKLKSPDLQRFERYLASWAYVRRHRVIAFTFVILLLLSTFFMPYLNLFVSQYLIFLVALILAPFILDIDPKIFFVTGLLLFFLTFVVWSLGQVEEAESMANYVYIILLSGSLRALLS